MSDAVKIAQAARAQLEKFGVYPIGIRIDSQKEI